jgi:hypothetical protein
MYVPPRGWSWRAEQRRLGLSSALDHGRADQAALPIPPAVAEWTWPVPPGGRRRARNASSAAMGPDGAVGGRPRGRGALLRRARPPSQQAWTAAGLDTGVRGVGAPHPGGVLRRSTARSPMADRPGRGVGLWEQRRPGGWLPGAWGPAGRARPVSPSARRAVAGGMAGPPGGTRAGGRVGQPRAARGRPRCPCTGPPTRHGCGHAGSSPPTVRQGLTAIPAQGAPPGTALQAPAPPLPWDLAQLRRRCGRQGRGSGPVGGTRGRQTETPWLARGEHVLPLARAAPAALPGAPPRSAAPQARLPTQRTAALEVPHRSDRHARRRTHGPAVSQGTLVHAEAPTRAPMCPGTSQCPAPCGRTPGSIAEPAAGCLGARPLPGGQPTAARDGAPGGAQVAQALTRGRTRPPAVLHARAGVWRSLTRPCVRRGRRGGCAPWGARPPALPSPPRPRRRTSCGAWTRRTCPTAGPRPRCPAPRRAAPAARGANASWPAGAVVGPGASPPQASAARSSTRGWR